MKKKSLLLLLLSANSVFAQPELNEFYTVKQCAALQKIYAQAHVKKIETTEYYTNDSTNIIEKRQEYYNLKGQQIRAVVHTPSSDADTMAVDTIHYTYLPNDALASSMPVSRYAVAVGYRYDKYDRLTEQLFSSAEAREFRFEYNKKGLLTKKIGKAAFFIPDSTGEIQTFWRDVDFFTYQHDAKGRIKSIFLEEFTINPYTTTYEYDKIGQIIRSNQTYPTSKQNTLRKEYFYDNNGILVRTEIIDLRSPENSHTILRKVTR